MAVSFMCCRLQCANLYLIVIQAHCSSKPNKAEESRTLPSEDTQCQDYRRV